MRIRSGVTVASGFVTNQPVFIKTIDALTYSHCQLILDVCDMFIGTVCTFGIRTLLKGGLILFEC